MVKDISMLISEFARATGLSPDTIRFYIRRGLLKPAFGEKGGVNRYQIFTQAHVETARLIRMAQSFGFTLKEIGRINDEYERAGLSRQRKAAILTERLVALDSKSREISIFTSYIRAKLAWMDGGEAGPEPSLNDFL